MSDLKALKKKIYQDEKIDILLEALECQSIHEEQHGKIFVAQLPEKFGSDNKRSVQIHNEEGLSSYVRSKSISGDIYTLVGYIIYGCEDKNSVSQNLYQIKVWICNALDYDDFLKNHEYKEEKDYNSWLKKLKKKRENKFNDLKENAIVKESFMNDYIKQPHMAFIKEGIHIKTQYEFGVAYDIPSDRIVFPVHNRNGELIGVKGRYAGNSEYIAENYKYVYLKPCDKSIELFNLHRALPYIKETGEVIVLEGAKSCMLLWQWNYRNCVSLEGNSLSPVQAMILKDLGVKIIFAFDKDIDLDHIKKQAKQIKNRLIYAAYDNENLLENHDSPVDKNIETWYNLYMNRIRL